MMTDHENDGALTQLRAYLAQEQLSENSRLPSERDLCDLLGVSRAALRKGLARLQEEGRIWRHVGRGTFVGPRPAEHGDDFASIISRTNPSRVMEARLQIEPQLARLAALHATREDVDEMRHCLRKTAEADSWRGYETWDNKLHRAIAEATHNPVLVAMFDSLNTIRRAVVWGRLRSARLPDPSHHSFAEHERLVAAISDRDLEAATSRMDEHLQSVAKNLLSAARTASRQGKSGERPVSPVDGAPSGHV